MGASFHVGFRFLRSLKMSTQIPRKVAARKSKEAYRLLMHVGKMWPGGLAEVRDRAKPQFFANKDNLNKDFLEKEWKKIDFIAENIAKLSQFHKYRKLKGNYDQEWRSFDDIDDYEAYILNKKK